MPRNNVIQHFYKVKQLIHISHQINNQKYVFRLKYAFKKLLLNLFIIN